MGTTDFDYTNLTGRPSGVFLRGAALLLPGVRRVQDQVVPYARAWRQSNIDALSRTGPLWVVLGDSMSLGVGASAFDRGWVGQVARSDAGRGLRLVNLAASGARVPDVLNSQLPAMERLGIRPALITVMIGFNDLVSRSYRHQLPAQFETLLARLPDETVLANLTNPSRTAAKVNDLISRAVQERGFGLADMMRSGTASWRGRLAADHFHPNDRGYAGIAAVFSDAITERQSAR